MLQNIWRALAAGAAILPRSLHILSALLWLIVASAFAAASAASADYQGISPAAGACEGQVSAPAKPNAVAGCTVQLDRRQQKIATLITELNASCDRQRRLQQNLTTCDANIRPAMREEAAEAAATYRRLVELIGPVRSSLANALPAAVTMLLGFGAVVLAGAHARRLGIPRLSGFAPARRPFWVSAALTFGVGAFVTCWESFDSNKDGFDWASYCLAGPLKLGTFQSYRLAGAAFWLAHAPLAALSALMGIQTVIGWHITRPRFMPLPDRHKYDWGIKRYTAFLELWSFVIVVMSAVITALWVRGLVASHTNVQMFFMGFGSLPPAVWLTARMVRNAHLLSARCQRLHFTVRKPNDLPAVPSGGLLSDGFWQLPTLFASATAIASALIQWGGVGKLLGF